MTEIPRYTKTTSKFNGWASIVSFTSSWKEEYTSPPFLLSLQNEEIIYGPKKQDITPKACQEV